MSEDFSTLQAWPQASPGARPVDQGGAWARSGAAPHCARFLYGLAFGLSRSLAVPSADLADGDGVWMGASSQGAGCPASCPPAEEHGQILSAAVLSADRDR